MNLIKLHVFVPLSPPPISFFLQGNFAHTAGEIMKRANFTTLEMEIYYTAAILAIKRAKESKGKAL